jgi:hypothetical protein
MKYSGAAIAKMASEFWEQAASSGIRRYDIEEAAKIVLSVVIVNVPGLNMSKARNWLLLRGLPDIIGYNDVDDRIMHGFIVSERGTGLIFVNSDDSPLERRFTVAHEVGHFIMDHLLPRQLAVSKLGRRAEEVLNSDSVADNPLLVEALVRSVDIVRRPFSIEKEGDGSFRSWQNYNAENGADGLALELLAPAAEVVLAAAGGKKLSYSACLEQCLSILEDRYSLPPSIAGPYAAKLAYNVTGGPSVLEKL